MSIANRHPIIKNIITKNKIDNQKKWILVFFFKTINTFTNDGIEK